MNTLSKDDISQLRQSLGKFVTGVTVVTTTDSDGSPRGFTASSFTSVSLDPPLVLVCIDKSAASYATFERATGYAVNVLNADQQQISVRFASKRAGKFDNVQWRPGPLSNPLLCGAAAWLDCRIHDRILAGDHLILVGKVEWFSSGPADPLAYFQGRYVAVDMGAPRPDVNMSAALVSAILTTQDSLLLLREPSGALTLPHSIGIGRPDRPDTLLGMLHGMGVDVELRSVIGFLDERPDSTASVVMDGLINIRGAISAACALVPFAQIQWQRLVGQGARQMVRNYLENERQSFRGSVADGTGGGAAKIAARFAE